MFQRRVQRVSKFTNTDFGIVRDRFNVFRTTAMDVAAANSDPSLHAALLVWKLTHFTISVDGLLTPAFPNSPLRNPGMFEFQVSLGNFARSISLPYFTNSAEADVQPGLTYLFDRTMYTFIASMSDLLAGGSYTGDLTIELIGFRQLSDGAFFLPSMFQLPYHVIMFYDLTLGATSVTNIMEQ